MNDFFNLCVDIMIVCAKALHVTYEELNVWLFVIIHPAITLILAFTSLYYMKRYRKLKRKIKDEGLQIGFRHISMKNQNAR